MGLGLGLGLGFELELRLRREAGVEKNIFMIVSRVVDLLRKNDHVVKVGSGPVDLLVDAVGLLRSLHSASTVAASIRMKSVFWLEILYAEYLFL